MKKRVNLFTGLSIIAIIAFLTACETTTDVVGPSLQIQSGEAVTAAANSIITIKWRADAGDAKLDVITIKEGNVPVLDENNRDWNNMSIVNADNETYIDSARVQVGTTDTDFQVLVVDKDGEFVSKTVVVTIEVAAGDPISTYTFTLGSYEATLGSSFASIDGTVYSIADAKANSDEIDFMYFYGSTNHATIAAPNDPATETVFSSANGPASWTVRNATKFAETTISAGEFDALTDDSDIVDAADGASLTKVNDLAVGDVVAFETASTSVNSGKSGLIKVVAINGTTSTGTIDLVVKVQE